MTARNWHIGIFGTFDVENYGDLLFPVIAEAELRQRLANVHLHRFSYHDREETDWPYKVTSVSELPEKIEHLDGVLIGGGFLIRFDKIVAHGYGPPSPDIHHPTGYWLSPALMALQHNIPVIWNAPGMHCNDVPTWAAPLLKLALEQSQCVRVRDEPTRQILNELSPTTEIRTLPDSAFGLPNLIDEQNPSAAFTELHKTLGLDNPYIVIQSIHVVEPFLQLFEREPNALAGYKLVVLPIGPVLGDHPSVVTTRQPQSVSLPSWPSPSLLAEIICHAEAVIGYSYHLSISALVFGVPLFSTADFTNGKYTALAEMGAIHTPPSTGEMTAEWFTSRIGKTRPSPAVTEAGVTLAHYWDGVAQLIKAGKVSSAQTFNRFWQHLPTLLENGNGEPPKPPSEAAPTLDYLMIELNARQKQIFQLNQQVEELQEEVNAQRKFANRLLLPLRLLVRSFRKLREQ